MNKSLYHVIVGYDANGDDHIDIANSSFIHKTYESALKILENEYEELKSEGYDYKLDLDKGFLRDAYASRGYYIQAVPMAED